MSRQFDPVQLGSIEIFCKAAELGHFAATAEALGVTPAAVSRSIQRLEERLSAKLFVRSTRHVRLTDDGRMYFEQCKAALEQIESAERTIAGQQNDAVGTLRISVPTTYAHYRLLPMLPAFLAKHPALKVEVSVSNRNIDFVEEGFDAAIRLGTPPDSQLVARPLEVARLGVYGSPAYVKKFGKPRTVADLAQHRLIQFIRPSTGRGMSWLFKNSAGEAEEYDFVSDLRVSDDALGGVTLARAGAGLFQTLTFIAEDAVKRGELVEVLKSTNPATRQFSILYPQNRHQSAKVRLFVDFMLRAMQVALKLSQARSPVARARQQESTSAAAPPSLSRVRRA
jgi:DNA-binding transcriptional LysR family regulator